MIRVKRQENCLFTPLCYNRLLTKRRIHLTTFFCQFLLILIGTFLIGISTNLYQKEFQYCEDSESFCSRQLLIEENRQIYIYIVLEDFYQNNRMFLDSYSQLQLQGNVHNSQLLKNYDTYAKLGLSTNAGGYRVNPQANAHPSGKVMLNIFNDALYLITSQGGAPTLDSPDLISQYNHLNKFINLENYQLSQWIDIQSKNFANYFTVPYTPTKYLLVGKVLLIPDSYQLIIKNNFKTNNVFKKKLLITQANQIGIKDPLVGFYMFISGILTLFFHLFLCCRRVK